MECELWRFWSHFDELFQCSEAPDEHHPRWEKLMFTDRCLWSRGFVDLENARMHAKGIVESDPAKVQEYLRTCIIEVRKQVRSERRAIQAIAADIEVWLQSASPDEDPMMLYPAERAAEVVALRKRLDARPVWQKLSRFCIVEGWKLGLLMWLKHRQRKRRLLDGRPGQAPLAP